MICNMTSNDGDVMMSNGSAIYEYHHHHELLKSERMRCHDEVDKIKYKYDI